MDEKTNISDSIIEKVEKYVRMQLDLIKLQSLEKFSSITSILVVRAAVLVFIMVFIFALSIAAAMFLGELLGKDYYGVLIVAGAYGLAALVIRYGLRDTARKQVANFIIKEILK